MTRAQYAAQRLHAELKRRRATVTLRTPSTLPGSDPQPNPPRVAGLVVDGEHAPGATTLRLRGTALAGRMVKGDRIMVGAQTVTVQADATAALNRIALTVFPALAQGAADGTPVAPLWAADRVIPARVESQGVRLGEGNLIEQRGYSVRVSAHQLTPAPTLLDLVILASGEPRKVAAIIPDLVDGEPVAYTLMVR